MYSSPWVVRGSSVVTAAGKTVLDSSPRVPYRRPQRSTSAAAGSRSGSMTSWNDDDSGRQVRAPENTTDISRLDRSARCKPSSNLQLDSMCWFSHRRSLPPLGGRVMVSSVAACCVYRLVTAHALLCVDNKGDSAVFRFCTWRPWPLTLTFELGRDLCTTYLTAKFDHPTFSRSEVIVRTNKQTPLETST